MKPDSWYLRRFPCEFRHGGSGEMVLIFAQGNPHRPLSIYWRLVSKRHLPVVTFEPLKSGVSRYKVMFSLSLALSLVLIVA